MIDGGGFSEMTDQIQRHSFPVRVKKKLRSSNWSLNSSLFRSTRVETERALPSRNKQSRHRFLGAITMEKCHRKWKRQYKAHTVKGSHHRKRYKRQTRNPPRNPLESMTSRYRTENFRGCQEKPIISLVYPKVWFLFLSLPKQLLFVSIIWPQKLSVATFGSRAVNYSVCIWH